jgi:hypothetical protein
MRPTSFDPKALRQHLLRQKIATLPDLQRVLGTHFPLTVFRKLKTLGYLSSYGTLLATLEAFVNRSPKGFFASELADALHAEVQDPLRQLSDQGLIRRTEHNARYLYTAIDPSTHRQQLLTQRMAQAIPVVADVSALQVSPEELKAAILLFYTLLDEQQRRLYAALESMKLGRGRDTLWAEFSPLAPHTEAPGRQQLLAQNVTPGRTHRSGGGRKRIEKKPPTSSP